MGERIKIGKGGELISVPFEKGEEEIQKDEWQRRLEKVRAELKKGSDLAPDILGKLWKEQSSLEKKLGIQTEEPLKPPGQYL